MRIRRSAAIALLAWGMMAAPDARALVTYEYTSSSDPTTYGSLTLDIPSPAPLTAWNLDDIVDFELTVDGNTLLLSDGPFDVYHVVAPYDFDPFPVDVWTSEEAPFLTLTVQPGTNDYLAIITEEGALFEVFRDLAVYCTSTPCMPLIEVPIVWSIVPEPGTSSLLALVFTTGAVLRRRRH